MGEGAIPEIRRPRSAFALIGTTFRIYRPYPWLFLVLAAVVVVPYTGAQVVQIELPRGAARVILGLVLTVADLAIVLPLVAAFHAFAIDDLRNGKDPDFASVTRRGTAALPTVAAAAFVSWLGIIAGLIAVIVPGVFLLLRWSVVAQSAALEEGSWRDALDRSRDLSDDNYCHVFALLVLVWLTILVPDFLVSLLFGRHASLPRELVTLPIGVATTSFGALAAALLYFDLSARLEESTSRHAPPAPVAGAAPTGHPLDPDSYGDDDRPPGWYVVPEKPWRMRYWLGDEAGGWSERTAKTPKQTQAGWWRISDR